MTWYYHYNDYYCRYEDMFACRLYVMKCHHCPWHVVCSHEDWGYRYLAASSAKTTIYSADEARRAFVDGSYLKLEASATKPYGWKSLLALEKLCCEWSTSNASLSAEFGEWTIAGALLSPGWSQSQSSKRSCTFGANQRVNFQSNLPDVRWGAGHSTKTVSD